MKNKKVIIWISVLAAVAVLGGTGYYFREEIAQWIPFFGQSKSQDKVYVEKVSKIMNTYTGVSNRYNGVVESQDSYEVNVDSSRNIKEILVQVGDVVEEGQVLVTYETSELEMQVKQTKLDIESINNDIDHSNKKIASLNEQLSKTEDEDEKFDITSEIQSEQNAIEQIKYDLESKNLEIEKYQKQIEESVVLSKQAGVVREINENGTDQNGNTAPFMKILKEGEYRVKGSIDEQNVWMVAEGTPVVIRSRVDQSQTWNGTLAKLETDNTQGNNNETDYYGNSDGAVSATKYPFYVDLETADGLLLGQHVYIEMDEGQEKEKEGLWLYSSYIVQGGQETQEMQETEETLEAETQEIQEAPETDTRPYVWAANEKNRLEKRFVELGELDENLGEYEILSGLTPDDYIAWPMSGLYEGVMAVTNMEEVDYSSPLYQQEDTEMPGEMEYFDGMESTEGVESIDGGTFFDTEMAGEADMMEMYRQLPGVEVEGTEILLDTEGLE